MKIRRSIITTATYKVDLSQAEARLLRDILSRTGGDPAFTRRAIADDMIDALNSVGLGWGRDIPDLIGELTFRATLTPTSDD